MSLNRFSSRRQWLDQSFLDERLKGALPYHCIAGYCCHPAMKLKNCLSGAILEMAIAANAQPAKITVDVAHPAHPIPTTLWGIFFEDINMSSDGGIYPELVRNLSFEDANTPENWKFAALNSGKSEAVISTADVHGQPLPLNAFNRKSLRGESRRRVQPAE